MPKELKKNIGSDKLNSPFIIAGLIIFAVIIGIIIANGGIRIALVILMIPPVLIYMNRLFVYPPVGLYTALFLGFTIIGLMRYIPGVPLGLTIDIFLVLTYIALFFKYFYKKLDLKPAKNDLTFLMLIWFLYSIFEFFNPEALSRTAWFYAMRGMSLYPLLVIPLAFLLFNKVKYFYIFLYIWGTMSILATIKGWMQLDIGPDYAEQRWLDQVGAITHILFGELRVFSFYSDAGQFGAAQGAAGIVGIICAINSKKFAEKIFFWIMGITGLYGMMISGTRGAIIVPMIGFFVYIIHRKNLRVIIIGSLLLFATYAFFKYTFVGQNVSQIRRMRTAFHPDTDASLQVRLENRRILKTYLATRPFGGGIGSAGDWGRRFSPYGFLSNIATDSWYVQIWAEQGIIGLTLHLFILAYIVAKGSYLIMFKIRNPELRWKMSAVLAGFCGIMGSSYGNGVLGQMPTGIITYLTWAFLFMSPQFDDELMGATEPKLLK